MDVIRGYVEHIIFQNSENGYTVLNLVSEGDEITCVGTLKGLTAGETIEARGEEVAHPVYGSQFKISSYQVVVPEDRESMRRYLASGAVKGIGAALAERIVGRFGDDTFRIMEEEPERLAEIKGISERMAQEISAQMEEKKELRSALVYLQQYGISNTLAVRIYETYQSGIYQLMQTNPYRLAEDIDGIGFKMADDIAARAGIQADSDYRIASGVLYVLTQAQQEGHVYLPSDLLLNRAEQLLAVPASSIEPVLSNMMMDKKLVLKRQGEQTLVYTARYYYLELNCARMLHDLNEAVEMTDTSAEAVLEKEIDAIAAEVSIELDEMQKRAVLTSIKNGLFILSGGPGTGKTTTVNMILKYFERQGMDILLAAPTGRAARRLTEATGCEARTIHRMLEVNGAVEESGRGARFEKNRDNPLEADVVVIDEMSMVDIHLFYSLLQAIAVGTRLIMVGDVDQLPSVGPGQVLRDLMKSGCFPVVTLRHIFRQAQTSDIVVNAHKINEGQPLILDNHSRDFFLLERKDVNVIYKHMLQLITQMLPKYVKADPLEIQVLTPMRRGPLGVEQLNQVLQRYMNPPAPGKKEHLQGNTLFREGDKVMQTKNNYQAEWEILGKYNIPVDKGMGIFNGDLGRVLEIRETAGQMVVEFEEGKRVTYPFDHLEELDLAYAVTIHKSQGSEYPAVVMPLLGGPRMLFNRNLLYTGVTRAKNCVAILGSSRCVQEMIQNVSQQERYTSLDLRIRECAAQEPDQDDEVKF
ncbi:MAG: ATP-dependent RecD-like DNA helicase [Lachnospiraceae bacterium]|nr:ATP-dependent RecD-like DNA helicase [Lachnospiraceae bacterium]